MQDLLYVLPVLACPFGMGLMMWLMMRPNRSSRQNTGEPSPYATFSTDQQPPPQNEVAAPHEEIAGLRAESGRRSAQSPAVERTP